MIVRMHSSSPRLRNMLTSCGDTDVPLVISHDIVGVLRADGSELSSSEEAHVRGVLAAHRVEAIT